MKQISLKEFLELPISKQIEYTLLLDAQNPKELIKVKIEQLSYNEVKQCFKELKKANSNIEFIFTTALKISKEEYLNLPIQNYFQIKKYIEKYFISLYENEIKLLQSIDADAGLWELAGGNELNEFSDVLPLSQLAKIYGGYPFDLGEKNYIEIVYLLRMNQKQSKVDNEYQILKSKQK